MARSTSRVISSFERIMILAVPPSGEGGFNLYTEYELRRPLIWLYQIIASFGVRSRQDNDADAKEGLGAEERVPCGSGLFRLPHRCLIGHIRRLGPIPLVLAGSRGGQDDVVRPASQAIFEESR